MDNREISPTASVVNFMTDEKLRQAEERVLAELETKPEEDMAIYLEAELTPSEKADLPEGSLMRETGDGMIYVKVLDIWIPYQMQRLITWRHPEADPLGAGYNIIQSLIAFASGGFSGVGYGGSIQKLSYLPECHTDFILAIIAEEMGLVGCLLIIGLFFTFMQRGFVIASKCPDMYGKLLAVGITFSITFQAFMNISVASSFLPATGVPLPFISYGGSSLIVSMIMVGILLNISKKKIKKIRNING